MLPPCQHSPTSSSNSSSSSSSSNSSLNDEELEEVIRQAAAMRSRSAYIGSVRAPPISAARRDIGRPTFAGVEDNLLVYGGGTPRPLLTPPPAFYDPGSSSVVEHKRAGAAPVPTPLYSSAYIVRKKEPSAVPLVSTKPLPFSHLPSTSTFVVRQSSPQVAAPHNQQSFHENSSASGPLPLPHGTTSHSHSTNSARSSIGPSNEILHHQPHEAVSHRFSNKVRRPAPELADSTSRDPTPRVARSVSGKRDQQFEQDAFSGNEPVTTPGTQEHYYHPVLADSGFLHPEEINARRDQRMQRAMQEATREEIFQPNVSKTSTANDASISRRSSAAPSRNVTARDNSTRAATPRTTSTTVTNSTTPRRAPGWERRLHDQDLQTKLQRDAENARRGEIAALEREMAETINTCSFQPDTASIHARQSHLKKKHHVPAATHSSARAVCLRLFNQSFYTTPKSAKDVIKDNADKEAREKEERSHRMKNAKATPAQIRLFEESKHKPEVAVVRGQQIVTYPIKGQWYTVDLPTHVDASSFERLHSEAWKKIKRLEELAVKHKGKFTPEITQFAANIHTRHGQDAFQRLSSQTPNGKSPPAASSTPQHFQMPPSSHPLVQRSCAVSKAPTPTHHHETPGSARTCTPIGADAIDDYETKSYTRRDDSLYYD